MSSAVLTFAERIERSQTRKVAFRQNRKSTFCQRGLGLKVLSSLLQSMTLLYSFLLFVVGLERGIIARLLGC